MSDNTNNGFPVPEEPLTREEQYLSAIAGVTASSDIPEKPLTRIEAYLNKIIENGGGGGGGTTNYNALENKPQINSHELSGNKSSSDLGLQPKIDSENKLASSNVSFTTAESNALTSGIDSAKVAQIETNKNNILLEQGKTTGMTEGGSNYITVGGRRVYVDSNPPTGARTGDLWIGG